MLLALALGLLLFFPYLFLEVGFAGDVDIDDMTQLPAVGGDDLAADQVLNAYDRAAGVRLWRQRRCLFRPRHRGRVSPVSHSLFQPVPQPLSQVCMVLVAVVQVFHAIPSSHCRESSVKCDWRSSVPMLRWCSLLRARAGAAWGESHRPHRWGCYARSDGAGRSEQWDAGARRRARPATPVRSAVW